MDKDKLQQVRCNDGRVITSEPNGENPREELVPEPGGGHRGRETYVVSFPHVLTLADCMMEGCPERAYTAVRIRENFMYRNWKPHVEILQEG